MPKRSRGVGGGASSPSETKAKRERSPSGGPSPGIPISQVWPGATQAIKDSDLLVRKALEDDELFGGGEPSF